MRFLLLSGLVLLSSPALAQGPLEPPAGLPQPGMRTLEQIEPRRPLVAGTTGVAIAASNTITISQPGSYYLTSNLTVSGGDGIIVTSDDVSLDLNGFTIASSGNGGFGISLSGGRTRVHIKNGCIRGAVTYNGATFTGTGFSSGVDYSGAVPVVVRISDLSVEGVGSYGIDLGTGFASVVESCVVRTAASVGIRAGVVSDSVAMLIGTSPITADTVHNSIGKKADGSSNTTVAQATLAAIAAGGEKRTPVSAATTPGNTTAVYRITVAGSYYLTGNIAGQTGKAGIEITTSNVTLDLNGFTMSGVPGSLDGITASFRNNLIVRNGTVETFAGDGIDFLQGNQFSVGGQVENVVSRFNDGTGIALSADAVIRNCIASSNDLDGLRILDSGIIEGCSSNRNGGNGIVAGSGCQILHSITSRNTLNGIKVSSASIVRGNICDYSGEAGLFASFSNRIEDNLCSNNSTGYKIEGGTNVIRRNTARLNTLNNWDVAGNNVLSVIVDRRAPGAPAFAGNAAAGTMGTTDPDANVTH